ncbi:dTMP kinase [Candidatus Nomurabacteria bacterium RIFCSPLOWO2_01_FULL_39_18]|uniref:Thymidylate kinase n=1 Tax=Candidatus Nomurabacteria bacterium RIFCSPHIGHO2_01_FULL_40_24b TaxID=1801739 RepID=A0A1F6V8F8_9BACT|nr:MAG: dTMP kinase [Candidatus Nomurabacteria bacterium RIFCSPHIGHO2_01_FULL_40_24b]OGI88969.1 MAG: dTMP kinase [Candidatus Nomurabacteria bacterium RIFCSPLOWO2_01_FULL_39_18]
MSRKGRLIVIDGTDGSGKTTQASLLLKHFRRDGRRVKFIHFPRYEDNFFGKFIAHCLSEQYYNWVNIHPKIASIVYAADRWESKEKIERWIKEGYIVITDRYISSNQIHQGGKIMSVKKRVAFIKWLAQMEYKVFKIPKPNLTVYLSLSIEMVLKLIKDRNYKGARAYLGSKKDVHEKDKNFLKNSIKSALWLAKTQKNWIKIECDKGGALDTRENIHKEIYKKVKRIIKK